MYFMSATKGNNKEEINCTPQHNVQVTYYVQVLYSTIFNLGFLSILKTKFNNNNNNNNLFLKKRILHKSQCFVQ